MSTNERVDTKNTKTQITVSIEESTYQAMVRKAGENRTSFSAEAEKAFVEYTKPVAVKGRK